MTLNTIMFAKESMWETMNVLANTQKVMMHSHGMLKRMDKKESLAYYADLKNKRCENDLELVAEIQEKLEEFDFPSMPKIKKNMEYMTDLDEYCQKEGIEGVKFFEEHENYLISKHESLIKHYSNFESIIEQRISLVEKLQAMSLVEELVPLSFLSSANMSDIQSESGRSQSTNKRFHSILGLIPTKNSFKCQKILFRMTRANLVMKFKNLNQIEDPLLENRVIDDKTLVFILLPKTEQEITVQKSEEVLKHYGFVNIEIPQSQLKNEMLLKIRNNLDENSTISLQTKKEIEIILTEFAKPSPLKNLSYLDTVTLLINREKNFAKNLIFVHEKEGFNQIKVWIPKKSRDDLIKQMEDIKKDDPNFIKPRIEEIPFKYSFVPPTSFETNTFSKMFQAIVDTYGIPRYKEINPGLFTIVTFPFLFGVMYGDVGHGLVLLLFSLYLMFGLKDRMSTLYEVRFMILFMGIFAIFCGLNYNEFFAVPITWRQSCYSKQGGKFVKSEGCHFGFGMDYIWFQAEDETNFSNSFKMKLSVVIGVIHMLFGIFLKGLNAIHFGSAVDLFCEAIPQFIFMSLTFGYMVFCIVLKWLTNWEGRNPTSIIQLFINFTTVKESDSIINNAAVQEKMQIIFILVCLVCVVLMFCGKPVAFYLSHRNSEEWIEPSLKNEDIEENLIEEEELHLQHKEHDFSEILVHQMIETIEFVLGSLSNTASYLRLWALSLAHGQLAKVFFDLLYGQALRESDNFITLFFHIVIGFVFFCFITFGVIIVMDTMECFLHALRLQWVEFQNKFFKGDGIAFVQFDHSI